MAPPVPTCLDACDANDDELLDIGDPVTLLGYIFGGAAPLPAPFPGCGPDPTAPPLGPTLSCVFYQFCTSAPVRPDPPLVDPLPPFTNQSVISITGTAPGADTVELITQNSLVFTAPVDPANDSWGFPNLQLHANAVNTLFFTAIQGSIRSEVISRRLTMDAQEPTIFVTFPLPGHQTTDATITVLGQVLDNLTGQQGLTIDVVGATSTNVLLLGDYTSFLGNLVPLLGVGPNTITINATDAASNTATKTITVEGLSLDPSLPTLEAVAGQIQSGTVQEELPQALEIEALDAAGAPLVGQQVSFAVTRGNGGISAAPGGPYTSTLEVFTDLAGLAEVYWNLGSDSGNSSQRVEAASVGVQGRAIFIASALPTDARRIAIASGDLQRGETDADLLEEFEVLVLDEFDNPAGAGIDVTFQVVLGDCEFAGGSSIVVPTNAAGRASASLRLGSVGNHAVTATFPGNLGLPVLFSARAIARDPLASTRFVGQVLEGSRAALGNATLTLEIAGNTFTTFSDADGRFEFRGLTVAGAGILHVGGSTIDLVGGMAINPFSPWEYPDLEYTVLVAPETTMSLPFPIYLPRLRPANERFYSTTNETTLEIDQLNGLQLSIAPGSMRINGAPAPDGTPVSVNLVQADSIPMIPPDGAAPVASFTLQPSNAKFDPPIRLCYPNLSALEPGRQVNFYSFDHATAQFEVVGFGQVDPDGALIKSDVGSGLPSGGWHWPQNPGRIAQITGDSSLGLPGDCEVRVGTTTVFTNPDGSFNLSYRVEDNVNGDQICVVFVCEGAVTTEYFVSTTFVVLPNVTYPVNLIASVSGIPDEPSSLSAIPASANLSTIGAQVQIDIGAVVGGFAFVYTTHPKTSYRSSNPAIASVDSVGLVTAHSRGTAIITARNTGTIATVPVVVSFVEPAAVSGTCVNGSNVPLAGAVVMASTGGFQTSTTTDINGDFTLSGIPGDFGGVLLSAEDDDGGPILADRLVSPVPGATLNVGTMQLLPVQTRFKLVPQAVASGDVVSVPVLLDNQVGPCQGYSFGLCYDTTALGFVQFNELFLPTGILPSFADVSVVPGDGVTVGVILDVLGVQVIPVGIAEEFCEWQFDALATPSTSLTIPISVCEIGNPIVESFVVAGGLGFDTPGVSGSVTITP